jgi:hypothetical protein
LFYCPPSSEISISEGVLVKVAVLAQPFSISLSLSLIFCVLNDRVFTLFYLVFSFFLASLILSSS